jgi:hypothetical protein
LPVAALRIKRSGLNRVVRATKADPANSNRRIDLQTSVLVERPFLAKPPLLAFVAEGSSEFDSAVQQCSRLAREVGSVATTVMNSHSLSNFAAPCIVKAACSSFVGTTHEIHGQNGCAAFCDRVGLSRFR